MNPGPFTCKANALPLSYIPFHANKELCGHYNKTVHKVFYYKGTLETLCSHSSIVEACFMVMEESCCPLLYILNLLHGAWNNRMLDCTSASVLLRHLALQRCTVLNRAKAKSGDIHQFVDHRPFKG